MPRDASNQDMDFQTSFHAEGNNEGNDNSLYGQSSTPQPFEAAFQGVSEMPASGAPAGSYSFTQGTLPHPPTPIGVNPPPEAAPSVQPQLPVSPQQQQQQAQDFLGANSVFAPSTGFSPWSAAMPYAHNLGDTFSHNVAHMPNSGQPQMQMPYMQYAVPPYTPNPYAQSAHQFQPAPAQSAYQFQPAHALIHSQGFPVAGNHNGYANAGGFNSAAMQMPMQMPMQGVPQAGASAQSFQAAPPPQPHSNSAVAPHSQHGHFPPPETLTWGALRTSFQNLAPGQADGLPSAPSNTYVNVMPGGVPQASSVPTAEAAHVGPVPPAAATVSAAPSTGPTSAVPGPALPTPPIPSAAAEVNPVPVSPHPATAAHAASHQANLKAQIWSSNDQGGVRSMQSIAGMSAAVSTVSIIMALVALLPVQLMFQNYSASSGVMWNRMPVASLPNFVDGLRSNAPDLFNEILAVTAITGAACNLKARAVWSRLQGTFGATIHSAFLHAVMVFIWASTASPKAPVVLAFLAEYLGTYHSGLLGLQARCTQPSSSPASFLDLSSAFMYSSIVNQPGYHRLDPSSSGNAPFFADHWMWLWSCVVALLEQSAKQPSTAEALQLLSMDHFQAQGDSEPCSDFFARVAMAHAEAKAILVRLGRGNLCPEPDALVDLVFHKTQRRYTLEVKRILGDARQIQEKNLNYDYVMNLYFQAEFSSNREFTGLDAALKANRPGQKTPVPPALKPDKKPKVPAGSAPSGYKPNPNANATDAQLATWKEKELCMNCGGDCAPNMCDKERRDGQPWLPSHGKPREPRRPKPPPSRPSGPIQPPPAPNLLLLKTSVGAPVVANPSEQPETAPPTGSALDSGAMSAEQFPAFASFAPLPDLGDDELPLDPLVGPVGMAPPVYTESSSQHQAAMARLATGDYVNSLLSSRRTAEEKQGRYSTQCMCMYVIIVLYLLCHVTDYVNHARNICMTTPLLGMSLLLLMPLPVIELGMYVHDCIGSMATCTSILCMLVMHMAACYYQTALAWLYVGMGAPLLGGAALLLPLIVAEISMCTLATIRSATACIPPAYWREGKQLALLSFLMLISLIPTVIGTATFIRPDRTQFEIHLDATAAPATDTAINNVGVFNAFAGSKLFDSTRLTVGPDSFADLTLITPDKVDPTWETVSVGPIKMSGIGGQAPAPIITAVKVPLRMQWGAAPAEVYAYVAPTPRNVDLLLGCDVLDFLHGKVDRHGMRATFRSLNMAVPLVSIRENSSRLRSEPLRVIATSSGCNLAYAAMRNLGFSISKWTSVDIDPECRAITSHVVPRGVLHEPTHDMRHIPEQILQTSYDLHIDTSPCQPFSRLQPNPPGFRDTVRTAPMAAAARLHHALKKVNPDIKHLVENVSFHRSLQVDFAQFQNMWQDKATLLNASDFGSPSSRPRQYMANFVSLTSLKQIPPLSPNEVLMPHRHCPEPLMPCIVASERTHNVPTVVDTDCKTRHRLSVGESEMMQGWPPGIVSSHCQSYTSALQKIGNALNAFQLHAIFRNFTPHAHTSLSYPMSADFCDSAQLEQQLSELTDAQLMAWVRERVRGWKPTELELHLKAGQQPFAKPRRSYSTPAGLVKSMEYMIQEQIRKGYMEQVEYTEDMFVSQGFCQPKRGRYFPGTDIEMCRLLADCRALNQACTDSPLHHYDSCPSQLDMCSRVPFGSKHFRFYDLSDAFHTCKIHKNSSNLVVVQFNGKFYRYLGGAQGIANMAVHWNVHLMHSFDRILGEHWRDWYTLYVDDLGVHGFTVQQTRNRSRILEAMLTVLEKPFSDKTGADVADSLDIAGLHFTEHGVRLSDDAFHALEQCLREYQVKNVTDIQHVVGVIQYAYSAFEWPDRTASSQYSTLLSQLNEVMKQPKQVLPKKWAAVYPPVRDKLLSLIKKQPWAYSDPRKIISENSCLIMTTDASDSAVAATLFRVSKPDAASVTKEDLLNPAVTRIVGVAYKKLTHGQLRWHTFESELFAIVLGCSKFGNFITTATVNYPPSGVKKIAIWSDSTTAIGQWGKVSLPAPVTENLSAKARRFFSWADKVAYCRYWPLITKHLPGDTNDIAHILSHLGEQTRERHAYLLSLDNPTLACPAVVHSFHNIDPSDPRYANTAPTSDPLQPFHVVHMNLSANHLKAVQLAYLQDDTPVQGIPLSHVYRIVTRHDGYLNLPKLHRQKVAAWINKRFFCVPAPGGAGNLMFAASSATINKYPDADDSTADRTRHLVMVVPKNAAAQITDVEPVTSGHDANSWQDHDLRRDILIHCHDNAAHASEATTSQNVRALAWFPNMRHYIHYHCQSCSYCVAKSKATEPVGTAVTAARRLKLVEFDHKILPADLAATLGLAAVLTVVDVVSRVTMFVPVQSVDADDTARALFTRWYPLFGVPTIFRCDGAPAFSSEVMHEFYNLLGVKTVDVSAPDDPTHHAVVEVRNKVMEKMLDVAISKGDLKTPQDLSMYCAAASAACNLEHVFNGHTVLEFLTAEIPRSHRDSVIIPAKYSAGTPLGSPFLDQLRSVLQESNTLVQLLRDDNSRYNAMHRDATLHNKNSTQFDLRPGDRVSYEGEQYLLEQTHVSTPTVPAKATIRRAEHDSTRSLIVKYSDLRPLTDPRPSHMFSTTDVAMKDVKVGEFVFFSVPNSAHVFGGIVSSILLASKTFVVHEHRQAEALRAKRRFTPLYTNTTTKRYEPKEKPQSHHTPVLRNVPLHRVFTHGQIDKYHIDANMFDTLRSLGVIDE